MEPPDVKGRIHSKLSEVDLRAGERGGRESNRQRWIAGLVIGISMLIGMILLLYGGYWLYHQKQQTFSSIWLKPAPAYAASHDGLSAMNRLEQRETAAPGTVSRTPQSSHRNPMK